MSPPSTGPPPEYRDWVRRPTKKHYQYRSRAQVVADMLNVIIDYVETPRTSRFERTGISSASLMYGAGLHFTQMKCHIQELQEYNLIDKDQVSNTFKVTPKGREFVKTYDHLKSLLPVIEKANK